MNNINIEEGAYMAPSFSLGYSITVKSLNVTSILLCDI